MHKISTCSEMVRYVDEVGFLPLLPIGITGWSADDVVDSDCRYVALPEVDGSGRYGDGKAR